ncbi:senescence-associated protein (macronuclear) [Tetrahymena thermophila SB210]|uniref:Senescence-associated protein n=1 Tax=Tetrahymena thermophila (strain SB210) TaxID=312017 RepID=Q23CJ1_TETTS|nr:senescence-associated protein [Tetrahymena thermophila SB210]EAR94289.3 senescence-associated protein [Tetrahymena thermophila SB210]|eukprot:XP_001014534.3 senescence-associated protein [Tetrahymena thermophila SB210]
MEQQYQMQLVFEIPNCTLYDINGSQYSVIDKGALAIYELKSHQLIVLKLGSWQYSLQKDIPVMAQQQNSRKMYAFPKKQGNFGIVFGYGTSDEQENVFESILENNTDFVISTPGQEDSSQKLVGSSNDQQQLQQQGGTTTSSTSKKIQGYLQKGGDFIRSGLITGAGYLAKGIQSGGQYLRSKISKPQKKEVKPETIQKVKMAKATSSAVLIFTQTQISALIQGAKVIGEELSNQVGDSDTGKKIKAHKNYEDAKNIAKGTVHVFAAIYDGMFEGLCAIGRGFQAATTDVVQAQYGEGAGQLAHESFETAANVGNIAYAYKTEAIKAIEQGTKSEIKQ